MKVNTKLLSLDQIIAELEDRKISVVSRKTGIPYGNLRNLAKGAVKNPSYKDIDALREYLKPERNDAV